MKVLIKKTNINFFVPVEGLEETDGPVECDVKIEKDTIQIKVLKEQQSPLEKMIDYIKNPIPCGPDTMVKALEIDDA